MYYWQQKSCKAEITGLNTKSELSLFLKINDCHIYKQAVRTGYTSRKCQFKVYEYCGKFGNGYMVAYPNENSTQYSIVEYWIKENRK